MMAKNRQEIFSHHTYDLIQKKDEEIAGLKAEVERLKSWEHFKTTLDTMLAFQSLNKEQQDMILLMMDGMKFRKEAR